MKKTLAIPLLILVALILIQPTLAFAAISDWQKGISVYSTGNNVFSTDSFKQSLNQLKATGANYVSLIMLIYQATKTSSQIYAGVDTPTDESLANGIKYAKSIGLKVML